jgi:hypothetical protein
MTAEARMFFFEKKNQKTFAWGPGDLETSRVKVAKSLLRTRVGGPTFSSEKRPLA